MREVIVVPYRPHGSARPTWVIYGRDIPGIAERAGWQQLASCLDETTADVLATGLARMSPEYLASLIPQEAF